MNTASKLEHCACVRVRTVLILSGDVIEQISKSLTSSVFVGRTLHLHCYPVSRFVLTHLIRFILKNKMHFSGCAQHLLEFGSG